MTTPATPKTVTGYPVPQNQRVTGYPAVTAVAPPPASPYLPFYQQSITPTTHFHRSRTSSLFRILSPVIIVCVIICLVTIITWLSLKPTMLAFGVESATVTSLNTTATELTATFNITLVFLNPNRRLSVSYKDIDASVRYGKNDYRALASTRLPPFSQGTQSEAKVLAQFAVVNEFVESGVAKGIAAERARGSVNFGVSLFAWVRFKSGFLHSRVRPVRVECKPVTIAFLPINNGTGTLVAPTSCSAV